ncbi:MAG: 23S rRNA (guanosine(2251)-2'-O)-methyltransferase RlmB [Caulobacterales bacterium 32-69-10]|nr:MAG: 23S rRNA (guanosine(2251)-2'-O)-methyltransferase RlmB [Caulobacterales bacterium 32-69-10]
MSSSRQRNDHPARFSPRLDKEGKGRRDQCFRSGGGDGGDWVWGRHAVAAALANPARAPFKRLLVTTEGLKALQAEKGARAAIEASGLVPETMTNGGDISHVLPPGAVHQGLALSAAALEPVDLESVAEPAHGLLLMLDQVTDPQNVGAIFRSAAAFGARAVILQDRHAPPFTGALAKAAAGAIDQVPSVRVVNLARALEQLGELGWRSVGLAGEAGTPLAEALDGTPTVLVLGSEGEGLRRLVGEHCDVLANIPMPGGFESLNVASAAAIALYEGARARVPGERD